MRKMWEKYRTLTCLLLLEIVILAIMIFNFSVSDKVNYIYTTDDMDYCFEDKSKLVLKEDGSYEVSEDHSGLMWQRRHIELPPGKYYVTVQYRSNRQGGVLVISSLLQAKQMNM